MVTLSVDVLTSCIMMSVDGHTNHNAQPAHQHGRPREEEAVSLLHGEELEHEDREGDDGEDDGEDHEGLHGLERIFLGIRQVSIAVKFSTVFPKAY